MDILDTIEEVGDEEHNDDVVHGEIVEELDEVRPDDQFSKVKAQEITESIKSASVALHSLMTEAYRYKAHKALGYDTWEEYVKTEFDISRSRSYQLIHYTETLEMIQEAVPEGTEIRLTEAQARDLKAELPRITEVIEQETHEMSPDEAEDFVNELLADEREQVKLEKEAAEQKKEEEERLKREAYNQALEDTADQMLEADPVNSFSDEADTGFMEAEVEGTADAISGKDAVAIFKFFEMLESVEVLPEPEDMVSKISQEREQEVEEKIIEITSWFNRFHTLWENRK